MDILRDGERPPWTHLDQNRHDNRIVPPRRFDVKPDFMYLAA